MLAAVVDDVPAVEPGVTVEAAVYGAADVDAVPLDCCNNSSIGVEDVRVSECD